MAGVTAVAGVAPVAVEAAEASAAVESEQGGWSEQQWPRAKAKANAKPTARSRAYGQHRAAQNMAHWG